MQGRVAMLTKVGNFEVQNYKVPTIKDDEILIKVEGSGVCGTDAHEFKSDPFGMIPVVLGHEGTGEIVKIGKNIKVDSVGKKISTGDKVITSTLVCGECHYCRNTPAKSNMCENVGVYGLILDDEKKFNGYFGDYMIIRKNSTFYNVSDLDLDLRLLVEPSAVAIHAIERAKTTGLLNFDTSVLVQGCGPIGLLVIAALKTMGIKNIIAVDGNNNRLKLAEELGARKTFNFTEYTDFEILRNQVETETDGIGAEFGFQCTGSPKAASNIWKFVRRTGGICEVGFFVDNGESSINPHHDICNKEITLVGSWVYTPQEYPITLSFLETAKEIGLPINKLITHRYPLSKMNEALETNIRMDGIKVVYINEEF